MAGGMRYEGREEENDGTENARLVEEAHAGSF